MHLLLEFLKKTIIKINSENQPSENLNLNIKIFYNINLQNIINIILLKFNKPLIYTNIKKIVNFLIKL